MKIEMIKQAGGLLVPACDDDAEQLAVLKTGEIFKVSIERLSTRRTSLQNRSLHKYLGLLAKALNDAGLDMRKTLKPEIDIPWTTESAKENLWRAIQVAVIGHESTCTPDRTGYTKVYDVLNRHTSERFGISIPWPSKDNNNA